MPIKCTLCRQFVDPSVQQRAVARQRRRNRPVRRRRTPITTSGWAICRHCWSDHAKHDSMAVSIAEVLGASRPLTIEEIRLGLIQRGWSEHLKSIEIEALAMKGFPLRFKNAPAEPSRWSLTPSELQAYHQRRQPTTPSAKVIASATTQPPQPQQLPPDTCLVLNDRYAIVVADLPGTDQIWILLEGVDTPNVRLHGPTVAKYFKLLPDTHPATARLRASAALARLNPPPPATLIEGPTSLPWRLLPPGQLALDELRDRLAVFNQQQPHRQWDHSRLEFIASLHPDRVYFGIEEYKQYFAFEFAQANVAVLDCPLYGNAIYVLNGDDWQALSQLTKLALIQTGRAYRIIHTSDERWQSRLRAIVAGPTGLLPVS